MNQPLPTRKHPRGGVGYFFVFLLIAAAVAVASWSLLTLFVPQAKPTTKKPIGELRDASAIKEDKLRSQQKIAAENEAQRIEKIKLQQQADLERQAEKLKAESQRKARLKSNLQLCNRAIDKKQWGKAQKLIGLLEDDQFDLVQTASLLDRIELGQSREREALRKVNGLLENAIKLDNGKYSAEALSYLDQARVILPEHPEVIALYKKMNAYVNEIRVPQDKATIAEAIPLLRAGDTLILAKGKFVGPIITPRPIIIKGAGAGVTIIECDTLKNSAFIIHGGNRPYEISDLTITGTSYADEAAARNPLVAVEGDVILKNVVIMRSSGHGIAVISGRLTIEDSRIMENAWDGICLKGIDSKALIKNTKIVSNYDHGIDFWQGASGQVIGSEVSKNSGSGIVVMGKNAVVSLTQVTLKENFQCGLVVADSASVKLQRVVCTQNTLSGIVIQGKGTKAEFGIVVSTKNEETGCFIDPLSTIIGFENATFEKNKKGNILRKSPTAPADLEVDSYVKPTAPKESHPTEKGKKDDEKAPQPKIPKAIIVE